MQRSIWYGRQPERNGEVMPVGKKALYIAISRDQYELPVAVADNTRELGRMIRVSPETIASHITLAAKGKIKKQKYFKVDADDGDD